MKTTEYRTVKANDQGITHIKLTFDYYIGGYSYATYKQVPRGYYLDVLPVKRENRGSYSMESFGMFSGISYLLKTVNRKSNKAEAEAKVIANSMTDKLLAEICNKAGLELA